MDYKDYTTEDFIKDEAFQEWVFSPNAQNEIVWQNLLNQYPDKRGALLDAKQFLLVFNVKDHDVFESRISNLKKRVDKAIDNGVLSIQGTPPSDKVPVKEFKKQAFKVYWIAASISFIALVISFFLFKENPGEKLLPVSIQHEQQVTPKGHRTVITLSDGTKVWLNADSRLEYPKSFTGSPTREVHLQGEAFFDVAENKNQPFIVHAEDLRIKVLGTSFNVRSYQVDQNIETTLVKGKVTIETENEKDKTVTLLPNQQAVFEKQSKKIMLENQVDTDNYISWKDGKLQFDDQPLSVILHVLERWYNVTIKVDDESSLSCRFSANVNNKTLEEVLELFKASDTIDYKIEGNQVFIYGKLCEE